MMAAKMDDIPKSLHTLLYTTFGTVLYVDPASGLVRHGAVDDNPSNLLLVAHPHESGGPRTASLMYASDHVSEPIILAAEGCRRPSSTKPIGGTISPLLVVQIGKGLIALRLSGLFLCAEADGRITLSRSRCSVWECFAPSSTYWNLSTEIDPTGSDPALQTAIDWQAIRAFRTQWRPPEPHRPKPAEQISIASMAGRVFTSHGTVMFVDTRSGELRHGPLEISPPNVALVHEGQHARLTFVRPEAQDDIACLRDYSGVINSEKLKEHNDTPGSVFRFVSTPTEEFALTDGSRFVCAENDGRVTLSRSMSGRWEKFHTSNARNRDGSVSSNEIRGKQIHFFVANRRDHIQAHHYRGRFYEMDELGIISEFFCRGGVFADIGANVGNHTIYVGKYLDPAQVIVIEPNPQAIPILQINVALNGLGSVADLSHLGIGLSDGAKSAAPIVLDGNLGGTTMKIVESGDGVSLIRGDDILMNRRIDFIKLDVEGMEMDVLAGLSKTIAQWRPRMFIELENAHVDAFQEWITTNRYNTARKYRRYKGNENYMVIPA